MTDDPLHRIEQLERRVAALEADLGRMRDGETAPAQPTWAAPVTPVAWGAPAPQPASPSQPSAPVGTPFTVDTEQALKWGGVGLVVLAVGFAVSTAISRGWIGPELQLVGALGISCALIATGLRLRTTRFGWAHALCSGGVLALYTTVASNLFLEQTNDDVAFACTVGFGLVGSALAWHVPSQWVASATVTGGLVGWFVIGDGEPSVAATVTWIAALVAIGIAMAVRQSWFAGRLVAHGAGLFALLGVVEPSDRTAEHVLIAVAAGLLVASLLLVPSIGDLTSIWQQLEVQLAAVTGPWLLLMVAGTFDIDSDAWIGVVAIGIALALVSAAYALGDQIHVAHRVSILIGASVALSIGLAIMLSTTVAFVALAVQGAGLVVLARSLGNNVRVLINSAVVTVVAGTFVVVDMFAAWDDDASIGDDIGHLAIIGAIAVGVWQTGHRTIQRIGAVALLATLLLWLGSVLVHLPQGQAAVSVSWAIVGTAVLVAGAVGRRTDVAAVGLAVLGLTVAKLLTVDLREVDTLWRAALFLAIGLGFLRLGFLLPRLSGEPDESDVLEVGDQ